MRFADGNIPSILAAQAKISTTDDHNSFLYAMYSGIYPNLRWVPLSQTMHEER